MTRTKTTLVGVFYVCVAAAALTMAYKFGKQDGRNEAFAERKNECVCGATQTCAFGPGVIGVQTCLTGLSNEWSRCEPDPRWRTP